MWHWIAAAAVAANVYLTALLGGAGRPALSVALALAVALVARVVMDVWPLRRGAAACGLAMVVGGHLGMLFGAAVDFGPLGLVVLSSWCAGNATVAGALQLLAVAPALHGGMLLGGLLGASLVRRPRRSEALAWGLAMLVGMLAGDAVVCGVLARLGATSPFLLPVVHVVGMAAMMALLAAIARRQISPRRRLAARVA